ncbi:MAG: GTP cyclohydrolase I FolE [Candidatus Lambdaproteobacteria bacterium RIFOXYD12_FULL_49_8]|uniref:GTP cyclohydrolase 1 n=1 Tax=Candidatus Lambdaproteobacteria bacterium RIFOXYD2_FULL_50_16 TaxID=1817772 RepID=A0A1F6GFT5_9PROT|nr:MAG: GTP cyclohydrolase I FolE [Candidatus Lambdaproteobacteria bacterium RIFOXYD12_FULL_49_8]OGG96959.1 MAG: GTP cyclohydrolase I FolE [Candidatus Lambdaproteobacteria bacterium RIFOXYD2_FULL_50_16]
MNPVSAEEAKEAIKTLIRFIGDDPEREGLLETPERVIRAYEEIFKGYKLDPAEILEKKFSTHSGELVVLSNIELYSTCEHHMMPFIGKCHIGYLPKDHVVGISKLARLMEIYSRRLQIQEEMTWQIAQALEHETQARGVAVLVEARHLCISSRGIGKQHSVMTTIATIGEFQENQNAKADFIHIIEQQRLSSL